RIVQVVDLAGRQVVGEGDDAVGAARLGDRRDDHARIVVGTAGLQGGVDRQHDRVVLAGGELAQPVGVSAAVVGELDDQTAAGGLLAHFGRGDEPVAGGVVAAHGGCCG